MRFHFKKFLVLLLISFCLFSTPKIIDYFGLPASASINQKAAPQVNQKLPSKVVPQGQEFGTISPQGSFKHIFDPQKMTFLLA